MRGACSSWKEGFERSVTSLKISPGGPAPPSGGVLAERFPGLTSLDLGGCPLPEEGLACLRGLKNLVKLSLGRYHYPIQAAAAYFTGEEGLWGIFFTCPMIKICTGVVFCLSQNPAPRFWPNSM